MSEEAETRSSMDDKEWARIARRLRKAAAEARQFLDAQEKRLEEIHAMGRTPR